MRKCFFSSKNMKIRWMNNIIAVLCGAICVVLGIILFDSDVDTRMPCTILICIGFLIWIYGAIVWLFLSREYSFDANGICVRYCKKRTFFYPWKCDIEVMLCTIFRSSNGYMQDDVIWISLRPVKNGPPDCRRKYNELSYHILRMNSVLTVELSDERLAEIQMFYKRPIPDYRIK